MYRKSSAWSVKGSAIYLRQNVKDSILMLACYVYKFFRSSERRSIIVYVICGKSGARWESGQEGIQTNSFCVQCMRIPFSVGILQLLFVVIFNLTVNDAPEEVGLYQKSRWVGRCHFSVFMGLMTDLRPLKGTGARIDLAFFQPGLRLFLAKGYDLLEGINSGDHRMLDLNSG